VVVLISLACIYQLSFYGSYKDTREKKQQIMQKKPLFSVQKTQDYRDIDELDQAFFSWIHSETPNKAIISTL